MSVSCRDLQGNKLAYGAERGLLPCVWVIPGRHVSWLEDTCRQRLVWPSSGSHSNAKLQARHATLALAPRMIDSREAEFVKYTARARGKVSELLTFVRYGHSWPYVVRLPDGLGTIHLAYGKGHLEGSPRYHQGSYLLKSLLLTCSATASEAPMVQRGQDH